MSNNGISTRAATRASGADRPILTVAAFGSCVSRDTIAHMEGQENPRWKSGPYIARQSLMSAEHPLPGGIVDDSLLPSPFTRKQLAADLVCDRRGALARLATTSDVLMWDIIDERLGVFQFPDGGVLTRTTEGLTASLYENLPEARLLEFGSDEHWELWRISLSSWRADLEATGLWNRTVLIYAPWALRDTQGSPSPASWDMDAALANWISVRYYDAVREIVEVPLLTLPDELVLTDPDHRWGSAPFHYISQAYEWIGEQVTEWASHLH